MLSNIVRAIGRRAGFEVKRPAKLPYSNACISLPPPKGSAKGRCLLAYILAPFEDQAQARNTAHTHFAESVLIADVWTALGYQVDAIDYRNHQFVPTQHYDYFVSARKHLAEVGARLGPECMKIAHLDTCHFATNNRSAFERLAAFQQRHQVSVPESLRLIENNLGIDAADVGILLGNATTQASYEYAGKPLHPLNVPAALDFNWDSGKDYGAAANQFLWFGSSGMLHKGLDLVLEAFARLPSLKLIVCGPVANEPRFLKCYEKLLATASNIHIEGWVDVGSPRFKELINTSIGIVYPSCGEGQAGSVVTGLKAGLLPAVSPQTGLDVGDYGRLIEYATVEAVIASAEAIAASSPEDLREQSHQAWVAGQMHHTPAAYKAHYQSILTSGVLAVRS